MGGQDKNNKKRQRQIKARVLQARIPEDLDEELRERATTLGLSVSTIVRNVLMNTFNLVEGVVADSTQLAHTIGGRGARLPVTPGEDTEAAPVIAWQQAALNLNAVCDQCNCVLLKGDQAAVGIPISKRPVFLCLDCMAELVPAKHEDEPEEGFND